MNWFKKLLCKLFGHKWEYYSFMPYWGYYSYDAEQAGNCKRCGYDTHKCCTFQEYYVRR